MRYTRVFGLAMFGLVSTFCTAHAHNPQGLLHESTLKMKTPGEGAPDVANDVLTLTAQRDSFSHLRSLLRAQLSTRTPVAEIMRPMGVSAPDSDQAFTAVIQSFGTKTARWTPGKNLKLCFMDGNPDAWNNVLNVYKSVIMGANLTVTSVGDCHANQGDVRVSFETGDGYWSVVGIAANRVDKSEPTIGLDGLGHAGAFSDDETGTATHEIMHSIGFEHEQQRPDVRCNYKSDADIGALLGWTIEMVKTNFHPITVSNPLLSHTVDKDSPMYYQLTGDFFSDGENDPCFQPARNNVLTDVDRQTIKIMYP